MVESQEDRRLLNVDWRNPVDSFDVDNDGSASPLDALVVINYINAGQPGPLPAVYDSTKPYLDVDGDQTASPLDVLSVINHLNAGSGNAARGEGEGDKFYIDVSGDNVLSPLDALLVINRLNSMRSGAGEGEGSSVNSSATDSIFGDESGMDQLLTQLAPDIEDLRKKR